MTSGVIRAATDRDCDRFAALHALSFDEPWDAAALRVLTDSPGVIALTSSDGFILVRVAADEAEILTIAVDPALRRGGQGGALLAAATEAAKAVGAQRLFLEVSSENAAARGLYARHGFAQVGHRARYYGDGSDALVLALTLA